jgi:hypothetical protein
MVSAWGCDQRLVLAQIATDAKSNEITAVPKLLKMLCLKGTIVTVGVQRALIALECQGVVAALFDNLLGNLPLGGDAGA